jgi:hypothetical protein
MRKTTKESQSRLLSFRTGIERKNSRVQSWVLMSQPWSSMSYESSFLCQHTGCNLSGILLLRTLSLPWSPTLHYRIDKTPPLGHVMRHLSPLRKPIFYFSNINFNIILPGLLNGSFLAILGLKLHHHSSFPCVLESQVLFADAWLNPSTVPNLWNTLCYTTSGLSTTQPSPSPPHSLIDIRRESVAPKGKHLALTFETDLKGYCFLIIFREANRNLMLDWCQLIICRSSSSQWNLYNIVCKLRQQFLPAFSLASFEKLARGEGLNVQSQYDVFQLIVNDQIK